ncbi:MAG: hypothetical protein ACI4J0_09315 [Huintestinicola sp.]|uniref:hypothetical protein n=1 Tax=Huintestinicola sp. TaxID=2981661 RepID=UPI003F10B3CB
MTAEEKKRLAEFERDIKKMQKDHKETFAEFEPKKSLPRQIGDRLKSIFILIFNRSVDKDGR